MGNGGESEQPDELALDARVSIDAVDLDDVDYALLVVINDLPQDLILVLKNGAAISVCPTADAIQKLQGRNITIKIVNLMDPALNLKEGKVKWPEDSVVTTKHKPPV